MANNFANQVGGINFDFNTVPDLQPKNIRGIIKLQTLPEENVLRSAIKTVPVADMLFKARIDDAINLDMTPEVGMTADDPMVGDNWRWKTDQVNSYRQACKISVEIGQQLLAPEGDPRKYAGQSELNRLINRVTVAVDNRREYNRAMGISNAHAYDPIRESDLKSNNIVSVVEANKKFDSTEKDAKGYLICEPFNLISTCANRLGFISGKMPTDLIVTPDVMTALENVNATNRTNELTAPRKPGARYTCRNLQVFVSQGRKNVGTNDAPVIKPLFENQLIICSLDPDTVAENQYDINRVEQFTTADRLFYYVRYWHKSRVHVSRPINFFYVKDVLANPYEFNNVDSLIS